MDILSEAIYQAAEIMAQNYGYIFICREQKYAKDDWFWGNKVAAVKYWQEHDFKEELTYDFFKFIYPKFEEEIDPDDVHPSIKTDLHFGNPRITFRAHDNNGSFCLTYDRETYEFKEGQVWQEYGFDRALWCKEMIERYLSLHG